MKKQLKGLLTFIVIMFSISYLHAQCPGNKVQMFKPTHSGCISKCVPPNKVDQYASQGWLYFCPNSGGWEFPSLEEDSAIATAPCLKVTVQRPDNFFVPNVQVTIRSETGTLITVNTDAHGVAQFDSIDPDQYVVKWFDDLKN
jgi:hypothetical protein